MKLLKRTALCMLSSVCLLSQSAVAFADAKGTWKYEEGSWKHYNAAGEKSIGWILSGENWYYLDAASKVMKTGWHRDSDGHWYFLSTAEGAELGKMLTGWVWVDGYCYYLKENAPNRGSLYIDTETPGGYHVDKEGRWVEKEGTPVYQSGKGLSSKSPAKEEKAAE
ncbi:MAG: ubiquinone biosynthesis protein UbiD, partial [Johnsonella sp.]|nr:ubiquinone biosynthesis protein UbiD [Johnsonella sp.]